MNELNFLTVAEVHKKLEKKEISSEEVTKSCLERIKKLESKIKAFVSVNEDEAIKKAKQVDKKRMIGGKLGKLAGIPFSLKDNFCTAGIATTASSNILKTFIPPYNATVYQRLIEEDAILLGKTNMDSFAHGSSTETSDFFTTSNPWKRDHLPGGSSGGSAASMAADEAIFSIGSETAGSIRHPASWCGVTGLKPTYGRVSRYGVIAMGSSLDSPGPIAKTVFDAAQIFMIIAGKDPFDATSSEYPVRDVIHTIKNGVKGLRIGVADCYFNDIQIEIHQSVYQALKVLEGLGVEIVKIDLFDPQYAIAVYTILQRSEVSSNLARYDGIRMGNTRDNFNTENKRRIMLGTYTLSAGYYDDYYKKAQEVRTLIKNDFAEKFNTVDVIIAPTTPVTALKKGASKESAMFGELMDVLVEPSTIAGLPGLSIPCGFSNGLPIGMQIIGPQFKEDIIMQVGYAYQSETDWHRKKPELS